MTDASIDEIGQPIDLADVGVEVIGRHKRVIDVRLNDMPNAFDAKPWQVEVGVVFGDFERGIETGVGRDSRV